MISSECRVRKVNSSCDVGGNLDLTALDRIHLDANLPSIRSDLRTSGGNFNNIILYFDPQTALGLYTWNSTSSAFGGSSAGLPG